MSHKFEFPLSALKLDLKGNNYHFESMKNQMGSWNLFLHVFYPCPENPQKNVIHASLSLVSSQSVESSFKKIKIYAKSKGSNQELAKNFQPMEVYNVKHFPEKQIIAFNFDIFEDLIDVIFTIDASDLPLESPPQTTSIHEPKSQYMQEQLFDSGVFADVIVKTKGGREIRAHNWILSRSKIFYTMINIFDRHMCSNHVIEFKDVDHDLMKEFIRFLYSNTVPKLNEMAKGLLVLAFNYDIPELVNICGFHLIEKKDVESIADILIPADKMNITLLKHAAIQFAIKNRANVAATESWKKLKELHPKVALEVAEQLMNNMTL